MVEITPLNEKLNLTKYKIFLLDACGNLKMCGEEKFRPKDDGKKLSKIPLTFRKNDVLDKKDEYLPDDKLTLLCECIFYTGEQIKEIERTVHEIPSVALNQIGIYDSSDYGFNFAQKLAVCPSIGDELEGLYNTQLLTDVELKTKTKSFRVHKTLLCSRSPVFKAILTNDMKEKNTDCIQLDDLEDDTVEKFLHFLYFDKLGNVLWESAIRLYYAAHTYGVKKLKVMCSSLLLDKVRTSTAIELLLLADAYNDSELLMAVTNFILKHDVQVFGSKEWRHLITTKPTLVSMTMCKKYL